jgi:carbamoyl-phosphate synthase large subunit
MDPMGIHTGDSITVAPAMTLSDTTFQRMRDYAILMMRSIGNLQEVVMCNLRFRLTKRRYCNEINPRLSFLCIIKAVIYCKESLLN